MRTRAGDGKEDGMMEATIRRTRSLNIELKRLHMHKVFVSVQGISFRGKQNLSCKCRSTNALLYYYNIHFDLPLNILTCDDHCAKKVSV